jgi:hypothetical protein
MTKPEQTAAAITHRLQEALSRQRAGTATIAEHAYIDGANELGALILMHLLEARGVADGVCHDAEANADEAGVAYFFGAVNGLDAVITYFRDYVNRLGEIVPDFAQSVVDAALKRIGKGTG